MKDPPPHPNNMVFWFLGWVELTCIACSPSATPTIILKCHIHAETIIVDLPVISLSRVELACIVFVQNDTDR